MRWNPNDDGINMYPYKFNKEKRRAPDHFSKQAPATSLKNRPVNSDIYRFWLRE